MATPANTPSNRSALANRQPAAAGPGIQVGRIFGIPIYLHPSWLIIFFLITLTLSEQFKYQHPGWSQTDHWMLGIITSLLFFGSVIFHELSHSLVARHYKVPVRSITLFVFGGLSAIEREPDNAVQEFNIAIAGPLSSLLLAAVFWAIRHYLTAGIMVAAAAGWLGWINLMLGLFNLVPGFPLDGGRILRGITWGITHDFARATRIAATTGKIFAYLMIFLGIGQALTGNGVSGLWTAFIGWFLLSAANESYMQVAMRSTLADVHASDIMSSEVPAVPRDISLEEYVHEVLRTGRRYHIVTGAGQPVGLVTIRAAQAVPRDEWANTSIQAVMVPLERIHAVAPDEPALKVLERMQKEDINQMPVVSDGHIVGMIARDSILRALQTRLQLGHVSGH
jgi:Zn-dependent protease/predicted transcriptional regulator